MVLQPDSRVVLLDQLRPPPGYTLLTGVATTFTLQLQAALVAPLAFGSLALRSAVDPISALEAVRSSADRLHFFCQAGQIAVPTTTPDLVAFLEPMIHPVATKRGLFHPKVWLLHYVCDGLPDRFRLLCGSRNLVDSRAWDALLTLEGDQVNTKQKGNAPLSSFIRSLPKLALAPLSPEAAAQIESLATASDRVQWRLPEGATELNFHALGIGLRNQQPDFSAYRSLVVSPFLNDDGLARVAQAGRDACTVVSTIEALEALRRETVAQLSKRSTRFLVLDPMAAHSLDFDAPTTTPVTDRGELTGLHAKVTVAERNKGEAYLFIGSANATSAAYDLNVEFLVGLSGRSKDLGVKVVLDDDKGWGSVLVDYEPTGGRADAEDAAVRELEKVLRRLATVPFSIRVEAGGSTRDLTLTTSADLCVPVELELTLGLLGEPGFGVQHSTGRVHADFLGVEVPNIGPFVTLTLRDSSKLTVSTVVHAQLINDPPNRLDEILARQLDTPEKFLRYLQLMLGLMSPADLLTGEATWTDGGLWGALGASGGGILELLLEALATKPAVLTDLGRTVQHLRSSEQGEAVLPEGFVALWTSFMAALETTTDRTGR